MLIDKLKFLQGYVKIKLSGYAPERFLNLCSNHNILIWNLEYEEDNYVFCISVRGLKQLKPLPETEAVFCRDCALLRAFVWYVAVCVEN